MLYGNGLDDARDGRPVHRSIERVGERIRTGTLDVYLIRPVPAFLQTAADGFALRRIGRPLQAGAGAGVRLQHIDVDWTVAKGIMLGCR